MATLTSNISLTKPEGGDPAAISVINANMDLLDGKFSGAGGTIPKTTIEGTAATLAGIETLSNKTLTSPTINSPSMTTVTVSSGGLTVTAGGLRVSAGNVGIGIAQDVDRGLYLAPSITGTTTAVDGQRISATLTAGVNSTQLTGLLISMTPNPNSKTGVTNVGLQVGSYNGSGSDTSYGALIAGPTTGGTNNYTLYLLAPSGGSTTNRGFHNEGAALVNGSATSLGFFGTSPAAKQTITGSRGGNAALTSLLSALAAYGIVTDSSSA